MELFSGETSTTEKKECEIWAIAGGKGGTGKSFITSCMGTYLSSKGKRVVLVDADIGGANLHSFLGINRPQNSLTNFFEKKAPLTELVVSTGITDLGLITGDIHSLDSNNIKHTQKLKFFRQIKSLNTNYIIIDLGAGVHFNTIDTFLLADKMVVVILPEITAIENMYHFMKNVLFRKLKVTLSVYGLKDIVHETWKKRVNYGIKNLSDLIDHLKGISTNIRDILQKELSNFKVYLILNQVRSRQDIPIGASVRSIFVKYFGFHLYYIGYIEHDDCIWSSINKRQPFMQAYAASRCAKEIENLSDNLMNGKQIRIVRS